MIRRIAALVVVLAVALGAWYARQWSGEIIARSNIAMLNAELAYATQLQEGLTRVSGSPDQRALTIVLSAETISRLVQGLVDTRVDIPQIDGSVLIKSIAVNFRDAFPDVQLEAEVTSKRAQGVLNAQIRATIEPRATAKTNFLELFIRPLEVHPELALGNSSVAATEQVDQILAAMLAHYAESLPKVAMPLASALQVSFPASTQNVRVPTQNGALNGIVDLPSFSTSVAFAVKQIYFLTDGIHLVASTDVNAPELLPFKLPPEQPVPAAELEREISRQRDELVRVSAALQPIVAPLKVNDADLLVDVAPQLLNSILTAVNELPEASRTIRYRTVSEDGQLYRAGGGGLGCGGYAELVGHNSATANVVVGALTTEFTDGALMASGQLSLKFAAQVTGHVHGPAGARTRMELRCVGEGWLRVCTDWPVVTVSCDSPMGGGVGLGNYGVSGNREERFTAQVTLRGDADSWLHYDIVIVSPTQVPITAEIGLGELGRLGLPFTFDIPRSSIASGTAPPIIGGRGRLESDGLARFAAREYAVSVNPHTSTMSASGYRLKAKVVVEWIQQDQ